MRALLIMLGALACVAKDAGTKQQALEAKQQKALRAKHIVQHQQAIDLNAHHQQIQSVDLNQRHDSQKEDPKKSGEKKCSRNRIVAGVMAIFLLPFGAHRWYYGYYLIATIYCMITLLQCVLFYVSRATRRRLKQNKQSERRTCDIWLYYISTIKLLAIFLVLFGVWIWECFLVWTRIQKPVNLAQSSLFNWKVEDCQFD